MAIQYTQKAQRALDLAFKISKELQHGYVGSEHILLGLLREGTGVAAKVLLSNGVEDDKLIDLIEQLIAPDQSVAVAERDGFTPRAEMILANGRQEATKMKAAQVGTEHLLIAIIKEPVSVAARLLTTIGINLQKIYADIIQAMGEDVAKYTEELQAMKNGRKKAKNATQTLDQYSRDLTALAAEGKLDPVIGRQVEITRIIQTLSRRTKNNPCLIGDPGVGKTAIVEGLALRIVEGDVPATVQDKRVLTLDLSGMIAGSKYRGEFEERIKKVIKEIIAAGDILLFVDELHTIIGAGGAEGAIDASNILKPSLARGEIQLIGATTYDEYRKHIEKDAALERRFQPINVEEPTIEVATEILSGIKSKYEEHHNVTITDEAVEAAVKLSARYLNDRRLPDKAIDLMDEAAAKVRLKGLKRPESLSKAERQIKQFENEKLQLLKDGKFTEAGQVGREQEKIRHAYEKKLARYEKSIADQKLIVDENEIADIVSEWTKIPVQKLAEAEGEKLVKMEATLQKRVIGQDEAVSAVAKAIKRGRVGLKEPNRPIGSFLFLGPTGVGKTELSKTLTEALFGSENALIRVDMSEYMEKHTVSKLIGSPPGYVGFDEGGQLSEKIRRNPYSVVLFDEIEKAHPDVFNVLLQVLDDGHITDSTGRKVSFKNCVIIMTSNAGAQRIVDPKKLGFSSKEDDTQDYEKMKSGVMEEVKRIFKPEFINRIDEIIVFHALNKDNMKKIVSLLVKNLCERAKTQMQITLTVRDNVKNHILEKGSDKKYGARPLKRAIQTMLEDKLAEEILQKKIKSGDEVIVSMAKGDIKFTVK
ncbi:MAG TPA: ATP-dependent Clp protease ATP-binding subunit [Lachnospiraceae bacterium]|nr:ATP-dependent Clp protease ATP-binding subunit [Lachnospiraceae bacterium]